MAKDIFSVDELYKISWAEYDVQNPDEEYGVPESWYDCEIMTDAIIEKLGEELTKQERKELKNILTEQELKDFKEKMKKFVQNYYRDGLCELDEMWNIIAEEFYDYWKDDEGE